MIWIREFKRFALIEKWHLFKKKKSVLLDDNTIPHFCLLAFYF
jgi:hypothetical protein